MLDVNLSLNQTLWTFLFHVKRTWMAQLLLAISMWQVIFFRKDFVTHMHNLAVHVKEGLPFAWVLLKTMWIFFFCLTVSFSYESQSIQCFNSFSSVCHLFCLYAWFLMLFHLTYMFYQSTHLLMSLFFETLTHIIVRTD